MKECILDANFEGKRWSSRLFTILLILIWELRYPKKRVVNRKRGRVLEAALLGTGANDLLWGRKNLSGGPGIGGNYTD